MKQILSSIQSLLQNFNLVLTRPNLNLDRKRSIPLSERMDYTRIATLELLGYEIINKRVKGDIAELGVYQGEFAKYLNQIFSDKSLYLFDTFSGFDKRDVDTETKNNFSEGNQNFSQTSVDMVLSKMKFSEKCIVRKGFFPDTARDLDPNLTFAFVSIDADLYSPIYEGLKYFYPKVSRGGYIVVHDFNNKEYTGANKAVLDFCAENNVPYIPMADGWGSVVIAK